MEEQYLTKPNGHRISFFYTVIILSAFGFLIIPLDAFGKNLIWLTIVLIPVAAAGFTLLTRLMLRQGIVRCRLWTEEETKKVYFGISLISIPADEISKIIRVSRPGLFGAELQVFTDKINPSAIIVLEELANPGGLIESLRTSAPRAIYKETMGGFHFLDWGLWISLAALAVIVVSRVL